MATTATDPARTWLRPTPTGPLETDLRTTWKALRRMTAASVTAAFPLLFILDRGSDWGFSPVLPGLVALAAVLLLAPLAAMELAARRVRRRDDELRRTKAGRLATQSRLALWLALAWFAGWLALGV